MSTQQPDLTLQQVSERLNVPVSTLREWMLDDMKCYWQRGHTIRFPVAWLDAWLEARQGKNLLKQKQAS